MIGLYLMERLSVEIFKIDREYVDMVGLGSDSYLYICKGIFIFNILIDYLW